MILWQENNNATEKYVSIASHRIAWFTKEWLGMVLHKSETE